MRQAIIVHLIKGGYLQKIDNVVTDVFHVVHYESGTSVPFGTFIYNNPSNSDMIEYKTLKMKKKEFDFYQTTSKGFQNVYVL